MTKALPIAARGPSSGAAYRTWTWRLAAVVLLSLPARAALAQATPPPPPPPGNIMPLNLAPVTQPALPEVLPEPEDLPATVGLTKIQPAIPRPATGANSVGSFIESLKANDASLEVIIGQARILSTKQDLTAGKGQSLIAVGDPSIIDFSVVSPRQIRISGQRIGVTDLSITSADGTTMNLEVRVVADLNPLTARLREAFPDASLRLAPLRDHVVVEGEARDTQQVEQIIRTITAYLESVLASQLRKIGGSQRVGAGAPNGAGGMPGGDVPPAAPNPDNPDAAAPTGIANPDQGGPLNVEGTIAPPRIINLIRVPGSQQVLLKVRVAELDRTSLRNIGSNFLGIDRQTGAIIGTQIAGGVNATSGVGQVGNPVIGGHKLQGAYNAPITPIGSSGGTTVFGLFQDSNFEFTLNALRQNNMLKVLAEPNLVALSNHQASFLAGGEFPVPVPQVSASGVAPTITVRFKEFGVRLNFIPSILDGDIIRLSVAPEVSQIDFTIATTLVAGGTPVPGLNTRKAQTTVEMREGQTLAIAGLLQLNLSGTTSRIPIMGDLPVLGPFFSNTTGQRQEKELVVLVTPYLVEPMKREQVPPTPGDEVKEPNDLEFYILNRIEARTGKDFRSTTKWDDVFNLVPLLHLDKKYVNGPCGFSN